MVQAEKTHLYSSASINGTLQLHQHLACICTHIFIELTQHPNTVVFFKISVLVWWATSLLDTKSSLIHFVCNAQWRIQTFADGGANRELSDYAVLCFHDTLYCGIASTSKAKQNYETSRRKLSPLCRWKVSQPQAKIFLGVNRWQNGDRL